MYINLDYILARTKRSDIESITTQKGLPNDEIDETKIDAAITDAQADVDNALYQAGYVTPVAEPTDYICRLTFDIAIYYLYAGKYDDEEMKDTYVRYNKAFSKLSDIVKGIVGLPGIPQIASDELSGLSSCVITNKVASDRVFYKKSTSTARGLEDMQ